MPKQNIEAVNISAMTAEQRDAALALDVERLLRFGRKHKLIKELDAIINYLKGVLGAKVACFFYEKTETDVKGSFRGNDGYDVCALAQKFGGGGHVKAAGCTISVPIAKAKEMVLAEVEKML